MARATPELVRTLRQRYENTDQLMTSIAAEFEIGVRTLQRMVMTQGWRKRSLRTRGLPIAVGLLEEAKALGATEPQSAHSRGAYARSASFGGYESAESAERDSGKRESSQRRYTRRTGSPGGRTESPFS